MPNIYDKYNNFILSLRYILVCSLAIPGICAQSQNPFEIKSRNYLDSIDRSTDKSPETKPITNLIDSPVIDNEKLFDEGTENKLLPVVPTADTEPVAQESKNNIIPDSPVQVDSLVMEPSVNAGDYIPTLPDKPPSSSMRGSGGVSWWYYLFDLALLLIVLGAFVHDKKIFQPLRKAFMNENFLRLLYRDTYLRKPGLFIYLNFLFLVSLGFILFRGAQYFGQASTFSDYLLIQGLVILLFLIKHVALHVLSLLVDKPFEVKFYQYWMIISAGIIGLCLVPFALMVSVLPSQFIFIALIITGIPLILLLLYRQIKAMTQAKFFFLKHFFQFFLYFCAIEIIPALLLADILVLY